MPRTLGEVVAVEKAARQSANKSTATLFADVKKPQPFTGFSQVYQPDVEDPTGRNGQPPKGDLLQLRTEDVLRELARRLIPAWDISAAKDWGNTEASADVIIGEDTILENVPVTFVLHLEKQVAEVLGFFRAIQTLDPAEDWMWDENDSSYRSRSPEQRIRLEKGLKSLVLIEPTQWQQGSAQAIPDEHRTGVWEITKFSGAVSRERKTQLIERGEALLAALRQARERANHTSAPAQSVGGPVFAFLLG